MNSTTKAGTMRRRMAMATAGMVLGSVMLLTAAARPGYSASSVSATKEVMLACPSVCEAATGWYCVLVQPGGQYDWYKDCKPKQEPEFEGNCVIGIPPESELMPVAPVALTPTAPEKVHEKADASGTPPTSRQ